MQSSKLNLGVSASTLEKKFKGRWQSQETKISKDAIKLSSELLRLFVLEAIERSAAQARADY